MSAQAVRASVAALAVCLLLPAPARGGDPLLERLDRALVAGDETRPGSIPSKGPTDRSLSGPLAELQGRHARRQRLFALAAARDLPLKARERLRLAQRAWADGQGRLLELLRQVDVGSDPRGEARREARALVARMRRASRGQPLSASELKIHPPHIEAPALQPGPAASPSRQIAFQQGAAAPPTSAAPVGEVPQILRDRAAALAGPVEIYEWVRNNIRPEFYHGVMKGAVETYLEGSGNDADTAALLIALMRAQGIPARFVRGTVQVPAAVAVAVTGTLAIDDAVRVYERAGVPHEAVAGAGGITALRLERVWAEAYVPYANYRGALLDASGKVWLPLDAAFKPLIAPRGRDAVALLGLDARALLDEYLGAAPGPTPLDFVRARTEGLLAAAQPALAYADLLNSRDLVGESLGILPSSMPYTIAAIDELGDALPDALRHVVRFVGEDAQGATILDASAAVADLLGRRLTISYVPYSEEDAAVAESYGGILKTPPYLIEVRPIVKSGGVPLAEGTGPVGMGVRYTLRLEFATPGGREVVSNSVLAGNLLAIGLGGVQVTGSEEGADKAAQILSARAFSYLDRWNRSDDEIANLFHVVPVRPTVSECMVMSDIQVEYAGGDPLYPLTFDWKGLAVDADLRSSSPVGVRGRANESSFLLLSGLEGSVLEDRIFEDDLKIESVSTAKALQLAKQQGIPVVDITEQNVDSELSGLPIDEAAKVEIRDAALRGLLARVPASPVASLAWTGIGYLLLDEGTGEAAYQLQGGHSGGVTAPAVVDIPKELTDVLVEQAEDLPPAPEDADVTRLAAFPSGDFQEGTVNELLPVPLKVLVTDASGFPVRQAVVVFSVVGGGGAVLDPVSGFRGPEVVVRSDDKGVAQVQLALGKRTDSIARYVQLEGEAQPTQVGLNLVTAHAAGVSLDHPFTAVGFPDDGFDGFARHATFTKVPDGYGVWSQLHFSFRPAVLVQDPYGNPLSNFTLHFAYRPPPTQYQPGVAGSAWIRGVTSGAFTPAHLLTPAAFDDCVKTKESPEWGDCAGEAESVDVDSGPAGAWVYAAAGDSQGSNYLVDVGTSDVPLITSFTLDTGGWLCPAADVQCGVRAADPAISVYSRTKWSGPRGDLEAYPLATAARASWTVTVLQEREQLRTVVDDQGKTHYYADGTNQWYREHLDDSDFALAAETPGTQVPPAAAHDGGGVYSATMTMGPTPQLNVIRYMAKHYPLEIPYEEKGNARNGEVDPAAVDTVSLTVTRSKDFARPYQGSDRFSLWGADAQPTGVTPTPILLNDGVVAAPSDVAYHILPDEFRQLLDPGQVIFEVRKDGSVAQNANASDGTFRIPSGTSIPPGTYTADLRILGVTKDGGSIDSPPLPLETCSFLDLKTPVVTLSLTRDPLNSRTCGAPAEMVLDLCRAATVSITLAGDPLRAAVDGAPQPSDVTALPLAAGRHRLALAPDPDLLGTTSDARQPFHVHAVASPPDDLVGDADGEVVNAIRNRSVLPVGHTFVKGVDLFDGHVVEQASDLEVSGRHLGIEVTRTYSSAGHGGESVIGAGWAWNYASTLLVSDCGTVTVTTADGSSQVFETDDGGAIFRPQKGYHTRLVRNGDGSYDFFDKGHNRHHFREPADPGRPSGDRRLEYVAEPHGDRIVLTYDDQDRVASVSEIHPEDNGAATRTLDIGPYVQKGGFDRVSKIAIGALGLEVDYEYDSFGNLVRATRAGRNLPGQPDAAAQVVTYEYTVGDSEDRHQLIAAVDANGNRTEYRYYAATDSFPGAASGVAVQRKQEFAKEVREFPDKGNPSRIDSTQFAYDYSRATIDLTFRTTVRDARGRDTLYTLNGNGSPLAIAEPLGKTTRMQWATDDILKTQETDPLGRVTDYGYDHNGNLTSETIRTADYGDVVTSYTYDPTYDKLTSRTDPNAHQATYTLDPGTGDLTEMRDGAGNVTAYTYDAHGVLTQTTDPRQHAVRHTAFDPYGFGLPAETVDEATGVTTSRLYDSRGRLVRASDSMGHESDLVYDGFGRVVMATKKAGISSAGLESRDEATTTEYWPEGQTKRVTNANGASTSFILDGLNRVIETDATGPQIPGTIQTKAGYDAVGNKTSEIDARGVARGLVYDDLNRLTEVDVVSGPDSSPMGKVARYGYDLVGNKTSETDIAQQTTSFELDGMYRVRKKTLPEPNANGTGRYFETYTYDKAGDRLSATDANGRQTTYAYDDGLNRRTLVTNALGHTVATSYDDPEGSHVNKSQELELPKGLRTRYLYDGANRETSRVVTLEGAGSSGENYTTTTAYDDTNHSVTVTDPRNTATRVRLDGLDRAIERVVDPSGLALTTAMGYDGLGGKTGEIDPRGHFTSYQYDGLGRLTAMVDALTHQASYAYDGGGLRTSETDRRSVVKHLTYDNLGRPRRTTVDPTISGVAWSHEVQYDDAGLKRTEIDARGKQTVAGLDTIGRVVSVKDALGRAAQMAYDGVNKVSETDKRGNTTTFDYDALNRLTKTTDPAPFATQTYATVYDDASNKRTETDRRGIVKTTQMDPLGRVLTVTRAAGTPDEAVLETNAYDADGNKTSAKDAESKETRFVYDAANRLTSRTEGFGTPSVATTTFTYDAAGNQTEELDQRAADLGEAWSMNKAYDALNRLETITDGEQEVTIYGYDNEGNRTLVKEPEGQENRYAYDELGQLLTVTQPTVQGGTPVTTYAYDPDRNRVSQTDANSHVATMEYDDIDRLTKMIQDPGGLGLVTQHQYDENGNETVLTDAKGQTVTSAYDELNRVKTKSYAFAASDPTRPWRHTTSVGYTYDENNNLKQIDEHVASGADPPDTTLTTTRTYDLQDRLATETSPLPDSAAPRTVTYAYYRNGTRKTVTDPASIATNYTYDGQNRLATAVTAAGQTAYAYWPDDLLKTVAYPNGVVATHGYDKADRLTSLGSANGATAVSSYGYTYDKNGNRETQTETNGGVSESTSYTYDGLDRLASVTYPVDATFAQGRVVTYTYDAVGNRTRETEKDSAAAVLADKQGVFDNANRLTTLNDLVTSGNDTTFTWDANGNQLTKTTAGVTTGYVYDVRDKLAEVDQGASILSRFQYGYDGKRIKKIGEEGIRDYVYDQTSLFAEYDQNGTQIAKYDYGSDRLISLTRADEGRRFFSFDGLRSVTGLTDDTGSTTATYHLDAWGNYRFPTELNQSLNRFGLTGHLFDRETGLYFAKARYLDPELGRFLSQDDLEPKLDEPPSLNLYLYANANPTRYVDPDGHESMAELAARERERRQALGQTAPSYTNDQGGQVVRADGPVVVPDRGPRGTTLDELPPGQRQWLDQEIARLRQERAQQGSNAAVTVQEERSLLDKYREKREQLKQWVQGKAEQGADSLTHPADDPIAEARKEELRRATEGTSSEQAGRALADRNIAKGVNETAVEGSGIAAREGTELGIQYVETEVGLRAAGVGLGMVSGGLRKVPNPFGKLGSPAHRMRVAEVKAEIEARGLIADTEVRIQTVGGVKDARYMDVVARDPVTNKVVEVHQVGRVLKSDPLVPVARERAALRDVRRSPELRDAKRVFHEY